MLMSDISNENRAWGQEDPLEREWLSTPVFLPGEFHGQSSLVGYIPWSHKELDTTERLSLSLFSPNESRVQKHKKPIFKYLKTSLSFLSFKSKHLSSILKIKCYLFRDSYKKVCVRLLYYILAISQQISFSNQLPYENL